MTTKKIKQQKARSNYGVSLRQNKRLTSVQNKGIDRNLVLSSGRPLPSSYGHNILAQHCELAAGYLNECIRNKERRLDKLKDAKKRLIDSHKRDPSRINEVPNLYIIDQKLRTLVKLEQSAKEVFDALTTHYKRATGTAWKPKPNVNEPIDGIQTKTDESATKGPTNSV